MKTTAETYAEKYMLMREDYEKHVQRLMHKLMQEQQARVEIEDKLEEAMVMILFYHHKLSFYVLMIVASPVEGK